MFRARFFFGTLAGLGIAAACAACIPHPETDFEDYQKRIQGFGPAAEDAGSVETGPPPTVAVEATYFAACLVELDSSRIESSFSFFTSTKFTPAPAGGVGGQLEIVLQALPLVDGKPPTTVSRNASIGTLPAITGATDAAGSFVAILPASEKATFPGAANPISGSDVELITANGVQVGLAGRYTESGFCARLTGRVNQPAAARRNLDPKENFCRFYPVKDGDPTPARDRADFTEAKCPL